MFNKALNDLYKPIIIKSESVILTFISKRLFEIDHKFYYGHYSKDEQGKYQMEYYPIPVVHVHGFCDIKFTLDKISITTKKSSKDAANFDYSLIKEYFYEVYGVNDYLLDFGNQNSDPKKMIASIIKSDEKDVFFTFYFEYHIDNHDIYEFVKFIRRKGFFY